MGSERALRNPGSGSRRRSPRRKRMGVQLESNGELRDRRNEVLKALKTTVVMRLPPPPDDLKLSALAVAD